MTLVNGRSRSPLLLGASLGHLQANSAGDSFGVENRRDDQQYATDQSFPTTQPVEKSTHAVERDTGLGRDTRRHGPTHTCDTSEVSDRKSRERRDHSV